jgi:hypothetical protein
MPLSTAQLYQAALKAGFNPKDAQVAAAISQAESSGNPMAHNTNAATGDNSYGLMQINMLGGMGPERMKQFGLKSYNDLFNPEVNFKAARQLHQSSGFSPWSTYGSGAYKQFLPEAQKAAAAGQVPSQPPSAPSQQQQQATKKAGSTYNYFYLNPDAESDYEDSSSNFGLKFLQRWMQGQGQKQNNPVAQLAEVLSQNYYPTDLS